MAATSSSAPPSEPPLPAPLGLPEGWLALAIRRWRQAERRARAAGLHLAESDGGELAALLTAEMTAPLRLERWPAPAAPRPVPGGWIHDDVGDGDRDGFEAYLAAAADEGPERVAHGAQQLRWSVTPYRRLRDRAPIPELGTRSRPIGDGQELGDDRGPRHPHRLGDDGDGGGTGRATVAAPVVVDLSTHWAGPLAGALLARAGARVVKIDPDCRPDGFRDRASLYHHLNGLKEIIDLDLRQQGHRARFEGLIRGADLVIESFSRRVMPNLGYGVEQLRRLNPRIGVLAIRAFPASTPEADWLAYGPGVHAASGLGWVDGGASPSPAPVAYPDLLAGMEAFAGAVDLLADSSAGRCHPRPVDGHREVSLAGAIAPLVARATSTADDHRDRGRDGPGAG